MTQVNEQAIQDMVQEVLRHVQSGWGSRPSPTPGVEAPPPISTVTTRSSGYLPETTRSVGPGAGAAAGGTFGQFATVNEALDHLQRQGYIGDYQLPLPREWIQPPRPGGPAPDSTLF